jgi:hypothetical protein
MPLKIALLWIAFFLLIGFLLGGSFVSAYLIPQTTQHSISKGSETPPLEERHQATEEAIAYYNKWLTYFTAFLAVATFLLFAATIGLYLGGTKQLELSRDAERRELRAYIGHLGMVFDSRTHESSGTRHVELLRVKYFDMNFGRTPALNVSMYIKVVPGAPPLFLDNELAETERQNVVQIVHPNQNVGRIVETATPTRAFDQFFLYGYVNYTDIFGWRWRHRFAFSYDPTRQNDLGEAFVAHHQYNDELSLGRDPAV